MRRREPMTHTRKARFLEALATGLDFRAAAAAASALATPRGADNSFRDAMGRDVMFSRRVAMVRAGR